jgi:hypothetical protein
MRAGSYEPDKQGSGRVTFRSRAEAKKAYLMRAVATKNIARKKASDFTSGLEYQGSLKAKTATVSQGNLLTGDTERIKRVRVQSASPKSAVMGVLKREAAKSGKPMAPRKPVKPVAKRNFYAERSRASTNLDRASKAIKKIERRIEKTNTPKNQKALAKARKSAATAFKALRLFAKTIESGQLYGRGSGRRIKSGAPRPSGTLAKPRNLKPGAIAARKAKAAPVKPPRTRKAATAGKSANAAATKAERVLARVASNAAKSRKAGRGRKQELKKAKSAAVADLARIFLQGLAVGKNDPNVQYPRQQLLGTLNNSLKRPLPKTQRRSTTKKSKEESLSDKSYRNWYANMIDIQRRKKKQQPKP